MLLDDRIEEVEIAELAGVFGTPLYVYSKRQILDNYARLDAAFRRRYPNFSIHYAVKANANLSILQLLRAAGACVDCASPGELELARRAGFSGAEMLYTGNYESFDDLRSVAQAGAGINLDDIGSLARLLRVGVPQVVSFRINPGIGKGAFAEVVTAGEEAKFGIPHERAAEAYRAAMRAGVSRFGIHMHVGSCILEAADFAQIVEQLFAVCGALFTELGIKPEFIDLGGGFGIPYRSGEKELDLERTAELTVAALQSGLERHALGEPRLIIEPGRYLVGNAGWLLARVTGVKRSYQTFVGVDCGMQTLLRPALYGAFHRVTACAKRTPLRKVSICGQICESTDIFHRDYQLPEVDEGDILIFHDAGAYGYAMASSYNGRPRPAEVLVDGPDAKLIRRRETLEDLLQLM